MKKTLLLLAFSAVASVNSFNAQTTWDFSTWTTNATGEATAVVKNNLALVPGPATVTNFAIVEANNATFSDGFAATKRFKLNGGGYTSTGVNTTPTQRYAYFKTNGNSSITVWYKNGGSGDRTLYIGNGSAVLYSNLYSNSTDGLIKTFDYVGPATNLYIYGDQSLNIYKIVATNVGTTVLGVNDVQKKMNATVYTNDNKVYVSNLESKNTEVNVFNASGSLVKTLKTSVDTNFDVNAKGFYIVNLKSQAGEKSVKVVVR